MNANEKKALKWEKKADALERAGMKNAAKTYRQIAAKIRKGAKGPKTKEG